MQPPILELRLKAFPLFPHRDHFVSTRKLLKVSSLCTVIGIEIGTNIEQRRTNKIIDKEIN